MKTAVFHLSFLALVALVNCRNLQLASFGSQNRIINGEIVKPNSIPYQVGLFISQNTGKEAFCGGCLITSKFVLTAAHCLKSALSVEVVLGAQDIKDKNEPTQTRIISTKFHHHDQYDPNALTNDIGVVELPESVELNELIGTVALPALGDEDNAFVGEKATVSGWGRISDASSGITDKLRSANLQIISNDECNKHFFGVVQEGHVCGAGIDGESACNGDSGGPLVVEDKNGQKILVGLVSFGIAFGCELGWPSAFTRVTTYLQWLELNTDVVLKA